MLKRKYAFLIAIAVLALALLPTSCTCNRSPEGKIPGSGYNPGGIGVRAQKIAFTRDSNGNDNPNKHYNNIYVMNSNGSDPSHLISNSAYNSLAAWSPDGTKIAFMSNRDDNDGIYLTNADGSNETKLVDGRYPAWSPDGTKIAFILNNDGETDICIINADGSNQTRLTNNSFHYGPPAWSPDGTKIAFPFQDFRTWNFKNNDICVINVDGTNQINLTNNPDTDINPIWSPDGTKIAFISEQHFTNIPSICVMNADGSNQIKLAEGSYLTWSPDSTKIAFPLSDDGSDIHVINTDGSNQTNLTNTPNESERYPSWSPNGNKIAYSSLLPNDPRSSIWIMNADGSNQTKLADDGRSPVWPPWTQ